MMLKTKPRKKKKGFDPNLPQLNRKGWRHVAIELNVETWEGGTLLDLHNSEVEDVLEIHHLAIAPIKSRQDLAWIKLWSEKITDVYISPTEFLAEMYVTTINEYALALGANVGRIYHNSCLGDTRIHANSIAHIFEPGEGDLPQPITAVMKKYVVVERVADGKKVTLRNRLGE